MPPVFNVFGVKPVRDGGYQAAMDAIGAFVEELDRGKVSVSDAKTSEPSEPSEPAAPKPKRRAVVQAVRLPPSSTAPTLTVPSLQEETVIEDRRMGAIRARLLELRERKAVLEEARESVDQEMQRRYSHGSVVIDPGDEWGDAEERITKWADELSPDTDSGSEEAEVPAVEALPPPWREAKVPPTYIASRLPEVRWTGASSSTVPPPPPPGPPPPAVESLIPVEPTPPWR